MYNLQDVMKRRISMYMSDEWVEILEEASVLVQMIEQSKPMNQYVKTLRAMREDDALMKRVNHFNDLKERYEEVQRFGTYHPEYSNVIQEVRQVKRELDLHEKVAAFQKAEDEMQRLLDAISFRLARAVSPAVKVDSGNPFYQTATTSCDIGCSASGTCTCSVSS